MLGRKTKPLTKPSTAVNVNTTPVTPVSTVRNHEGPCIPVGELLSSQYYYFTTQGAPPLLDDRGLSTHPHPKGSPAQARAQPYKRARISFLALIESEDSLEITKNTAKGHNHYDNYDNGV
jgi:hypothetical protein